MSDDQISRPIVAGPSHTITRFCELENISRAMWYKLRPTAKALGSLTSENSPRISEEARTEWRRQREAEAGGAE